MDIKHIFSRNRQTPTSTKRAKANRPSTAGAHELFLEYEGFLSSSASHPPKPRTPAAKDARSRVSALGSATSTRQPEGKAKEIEKPSPKSQRNTVHPRETNDEGSLNSRNTPSWRNKSFFSLNRSSRGNIPDNRKEDQRPSPLYVPKQACTGQSPNPSWLRRCMSTTSGTHHPSPPPSFTTIPPDYGVSEFDDADLTALPALPDYENELPPKPEGKVPCGTAARAAAAAQNEVFDTIHSLKLTEPKLTRDSESGVGIEVRDRGGVMPESDIPVVRKDPVGTLPEELILQILSYLDADSLVQAELVSVNWRQSASSRFLWRDAFQAEFRDVCRTVTANPMNNAGLGRASGRHNWKEMWRARRALEQRWKDGYAAAIYLEGHKDSVYCVQFDDEKILTGSRDRTVRIWDAKTFECTRILGIPSRGSPATVPSLPADLSDPGRRPFTKIFSPPSQAMPTTAYNEYYHTGSILCLQYDEWIMITGSSDCTLIIRDVQDNYRPTKRLRCHTAGVLDVCFDDKHIVSCSKDTTICLWDRRTGGLLKRMTGHRGPVNAVQMRGDLVVSASGDGVAKLWNIRSGLCVKEFPSRDRGMACVEFSPDSRTVLAGGNDQVIYQFDTSTGELVREMKGHGGLVRSLHLDSACGRVVSGSYDTSVKAYDLRSGERIVSFSKWTSSWILSAKSDYRRIIATSQDSRAVVMDFGYQLPGIEALAP